MLLGKLTVVKLVQFIIIIIIIIIVIIIIIIKYAAD